MAEKQKSKKLQFILFGLCSVIALGACAAILVATVRSVESSETNPAEYEMQSKTELKNDTASLLDYLKALTATAASDKFIKADRYTDISVDDSTVTISGSDSDKNLLTYAKNKILPTVDSYYPEDACGVFGTVTEFMPIISIPADSVTESKFSVGQTDEDGNPIYDNGEIADSEYYFITISSTDFASNDINGLFSLNIKDEIAERFATETVDICNIATCDITPTKAVIYAKVNRTTDEIDYIILERTYNINADVNFINKLEVFGNKQISFEYKVSEKFEYAYAGISFTENSVTVEPGNEAALSVNAVIENDSDYKVTFTSSDKSVATVDEMGYVKVLSASEKPVTITVTLTYLGQTFTDECTVYTGIQNES